MKLNRWCLTAVFDHTVLSLVESDFIDAHDKQYDLYLDGDRRDPLRFDRYYTPSAGGYRDGSLAIWGGDRVVLISTGDYRQHTISCPDPIYSVYRTGRGWCIVGELAVSLVDDRFDVVNSVMHDEVIVSSRWDNGDIRLKDFNNAELMVRIDEAKGRVLLST